MALDCMRCVEVIWDFIDHFADSGKTCEWWLRNNRGFPLHLIPPTCWSCPCVHSHCPLPFSLSLSNIHTHMYIHMYMYTYNSLRLVLSEWKDGWQFYKSNHVQSLATTMIHHKPQRILLYHPTIHRLHHVKLAYLDETR